MARPPKSPVIAPPPTLRVMPEVPETFRPDEGDDFAATPDQRLLREIAVRMTLKGQPSPMVWLDTFYAEHRRRISSGTFKNWKSDPAFTSWFYDPLTVEPDEHDDKVERIAFRRQLAAQVAAGDLKAMDLYAQITGLKKRPEAPAPEKAGIGQILEDFADGLPDDETNPWAAARPATREQ